MGLEVFTCVVGLGIPFGTVPPMELSGAQIVLTAENDDRVMHSRSYQTKCYKPGKPTDDYACCDSNGGYKGPLQNSAHKAFMPV
jgi:hypothetical protein